MWKGVWIYGLRENENENTIRMHGTRGSHERTELLLEFKDGQI